MIFVVLVCLVLGIAFAASGERPDAHAAFLETVGGGLVVAGLIGLGLLLARTMR